MDKWIIAMQLWAANNPLTVIFIVIPLVGALFNWVMWQRTPAEWSKLQKEKPRLALFIRLMRAVFIHLRKVPALAVYLPKEEPQDPNKTQ